jgi:hypothetical protein
MPDDHLQQKKHEGGCLDAWGGLQLRYRDVEEGEPEAL